MTTFSSDPFALEDLPSGTSASSGLAEASDRFAPTPPPVSVPWLDDLNEEQREAVTTTEGPVLVLSGAGTGKTRVLTTRLAWLMASRQARPWECLAVTFTNRAAREMRERTAALVGPPAESAWLGTFHALGVRILRQHAELAGLSSGFTILDSDDQERLLKQVMEVAGLDVKKFTPRGVLAVIQRWKDRGLAPDQVGSDGATEAADGRALELYRAYQARLRTVNACDFGDLLLHVLTLFRAHPDVLRTYQERFRYIMVDEYQDTNVAQYLWLRLLAMGHRNLCCVGDDDQSIYSWRGAEIDNILRFEKDFPGARVIRLERNYRSTGHILSAAAGLIAHNEGRLGKTLRPALAEDGAPVRVRGLWDGEAEARMVGDEIEAFHSKGTALSQMAILVRAGFQTREFEDRLITLGVPYRVVGGPRFYERAEIRDALAYVRLVAQPNDDLAFERIVNKPKRGLGEATLNTLHMLARAAGIPLVAAARAVVETDELRPKARSTLARFLQDLDRWRGQVDALPHPELAGIILDESGYTGMWQTDPSPEAPGRLDNLKEFVGAMEEFETLAAFLEHVGLVMDNGRADDPEKVSLMTLHAAKGLEFDVVFLPGWEEGLLPHQRALDEGGLRALEEERRLAHVGLTRARRHALISFAANRRVYNQWQGCLPSRFLDELPAACVARDSDQGLYVQAMPQNRARRWSGMAEAPAAAWSVPQRKSSDGISRGDRVFHQKFGYGKVLDADGDKLHVSFEHAGEKRVMAGFVSLA